MRFETNAIHFGYQPDETGAISQGLTLSSTFERAEDGGYPHGNVYSRDGNPNRRSLERTIAHLEGGAEGYAYASGLAAMHAVLQCLAPGDHIIVPRDAYYAFGKALHEFWIPWGLQVSFVDQTIPEEVEAAFKPSTKILWLESPTNPLIKIADIALLAALAKRHGCLVGVDNTWATPYLQRPLELGCDFTVHSTTKYLAGHSDVTGGLLVVKEAFPHREKLRFLQSKLGAIPSPFDCWLVQRGAQTLGVRMDRHCQSAEAIASFLQQQSRVEKVLYPGLPCHPGYGAAGKQMSNWGGMMSILVDGADERAARAVAGACKIVKQGTSLGGTHSLIEHRASVEGPGTQSPQNLLRLSVGLEHVEDLMEDLHQALRQALKLNAFQRQPSPPNQER